MAEIETPARAFEALYLCWGMYVVILQTLPTPQTFF